MVQWRQSKILNCLSVNIWHEYHFLHIPKIIISVFSRTIVYSMMIRGHNYTSLAAKKNIVWI